MVTAVDTASGERRVFERDSGVPLPRAIAASAAVPGLFPAVEIDGALYMDGQVHSSTNADLLLALAPLQVVIAVPTNADTGARHRPARGAHARARDRARSSRPAATVADRDAERATTREQFGKNLMDPSAASRRVRARAGRRSRARRAAR